MVLVFINMVHLHGDGVSRHQAVNMSTIIFQYCVGSVYSWRDGTLKGQFIQKKTKNKQHISHFLSSATGAAQWK